jgi:hypothetical protein
MRHYFCGDRRLGSLPLPVTALPCGMPRRAAAALLVAPARRAH